MFILNRYFYLLSLIGTNKTLCCVFSAWLFAAAFGFPCLAKVTSPTDFPRFAKTIRF